MLDIWKALSPHLVEMITAALAIYISRLTGGLVARNTLHSAIKTGVEEALEMMADGKITRQELIQAALRYARSSSPGAIKRTGATDKIMESIAQAKLNATTLVNVLR
jgi:hypothetical protein